MDLSNILNLSRLANALAGLKATTVEGKGEIVMRSIEPTSKIAPPVNPECKM